MNTVGQTVRFDKLVKEYSLVIKGLEEIKGYNHKVIVDKKAPVCSTGFKEAGLSHVRSCKSGAC